jgi:AcrR family transcriptional regulator
MANERMTAAERTAQLVAVGYEIARTKGIRKVTRAEVARRTAVSDGLLNRYFGGREGLRGAVLEHAVEQKDAKTLAAAMVHYDMPDMPGKLRREVTSLWRELSH